MWRHPYHYMHQTCLLYTITALCNVSLVLDKILMESSCCCCCCCCCGSGDRDRDFCIYKNLFLAAVWIVDSVGVCLANILFWPPLCWPGLLPRRLDQLRVLAGLHQLLHQPIHLRHNDPCIQGYCCELYLSSVQKTFNAVERKLEYVSDWAAGN